MRLAVKIFLSFWLIHAVILVLLAVLPDYERNAFFAADLDRIGRIAVSQYEVHGPTVCTTALTAVERETGVRVALFDDAKRLACEPVPPLDEEFVRHVREGTPVPTQSADEEHYMVRRIQGPSGRSYTAAGMRVPAVHPPRPDGRTPFRPLLMALVISGLVCFLLARYLAHPLQVMGTATRRLAAGDLTARAGAGMRVRHDEIGEVVHDFDTMADRIAGLLNSQKQLLSDISHELRSPLARLQVAVALARRKAAEAAGPDLDRIETEAERMNELIGQVLALARTEDEARPRRQAPVDLGEVVRLVTDDAAYEAREAGKRVVLREEAEVTVSGDADLLASAVENVVRNALRYTPEGTTVEVTIARQPAAAVVTVRDQGPGVPPGELETIFAPFHRVGAARTRDSGGTGLGLAIAKRSVTMHGGTVVARNVPEGGLEIEIRLPA